MGVFLAATLFSFFWVNTFFARGIADVRLMFSSMPVLLIFLVAALTMRQWSEEQRSGTLEMLLTLPVQPLRLVIGKFLAVITLVIVALALTLPLVFTVSLLGNLDFGPVVGGYLAAILLAGSYAAIGLYVSSRTDNQIVALIVTVLICGLFYLVGNSTVTGLFSGNVADILRDIGTGRPLREHRARRDRFPRSGVLPVALCGLPDAEYVGTGSQALVHRAAHGQVPAQHEPDEWAIGGEPAGIERMGYPIAGIAR